MAYVVYMSHSLQYQRITEMGSIMDYRDQLKYIKSHQKKEQMAGRRKNKKHRPERRNNIKDSDIRYVNASRPEYNKPKKRPERKQRHIEEPVKKVSVLNKFLWLVQIAASVFFMASMTILRILPLLYMIVIGVVLLLLIILVRSMQKRAARSRKKKSGGKGIALVLSALLVTVGLYGLKVNAALDTIAIGEESGEYVKEHEISVTEKPFNVYISGIDVYGDITKESRSDVNLIATINPKTHKILLTTTPRDYYVTIPGVSGEAKDKLTHAGTYGVDTSIATLENLYDTEIPFFVRVNFTSVEEIVNVLGGIDVESELEFTTSKAAGEVVDVKKGMNHFNGKQALAFVRERKAFATGDNQRGKNQQALLTALIKKTMSPAIVLHANEMINSVSGNADTNLSENQIKSLVRNQIGTMKGWDIESVAAQGDDTGKQYCYSYSGAPLYVTVPYEDSVNEIKGKMSQLLGN